MLAVATSVACGLVRSYSVEPKTAALSGWTDTIRPYNYVSEVITTNFDELDSVSGSYCELFGGSLGAGGPYHVSVRTYPGGAEIASGSNTNPGDHKWIRFKLSVLYPESVIKGKQLEFRFTRSNGDSLMYYYAENAYDYGHIIIGGGQLQQPPGTAPDLCMRVYARLRPTTPGW